MAIPKAIPRMKKSVLLLGPQADAATWQEMCAFFRKLNWYLTENSKWAQKVQAWIDGGGGTNLKPPPPPNWP